MICTALYSPFLNSGCLVKSVWSSSLYWHGQKSIPGFDVQVPNWTSSSAQATTGNSSKYKQAEKFYHFSIFSRLLLIPLLIIMVSSLEQSHWTHQKILVWSSTGADIRVCWCVSYPEGIMLLTALLPHSAGGLPGLCPERMFSLAWSSSVKWTG